MRFDQKLDIIDHKKPDVQHSLIIFIFNDLETIYLFELSRFLRKFVQFSVTSDHFFILTR